MKIILERWEKWWIQTALFLNGEWYLKRDRDESEPDKKIITSNDHCMLLVKSMISLEGGMCQRRDGLFISRCADEFLNSYCGLIGFFALNGELIRSAETKWHNLAFSLSHTHKCFLCGFSTFVCGIDHTR